MDAENRISEDEWFIHNTLPFVFKWLKAKDLLNCAVVSKRWRSIALDHSFWKSVELDRHGLKFPEMAMFLQKQGTRTLKMIDCLFMLNKELLTAIALIPSLRHLELNYTTLAILEHLSDYNQNLEIIKADIILGSLGINLDLSFVNHLRNIRELKLSCNRSLESISPLNLAANLQHLSLVNVKNMGFLDFDECKIGQYGNLKSLALGLCWNLSNTFGDIFLRSLKSLEKLRLEGCRLCFLPNILENLSHLKNLKVLQLIEIAVENKFENGLKFCSQIEELTVVPAAHRYKMALFNYRLFYSVILLKSNLRKLTWGFTSSYIKYTTKVCEKNDSIPMPKDDTEANILPMTNMTFITLEELKDSLSKAMVNTHVKTECRDYIGSVFLHQSFD